jgi:hypothetical protein
MARRDYDDYDDDDDRRPIKKKRRKKEGGGNTLLILLIGGGVLALFLFVGGIGLIAIIVAKTAGKVEQNQRAQNKNKKGKGANPDFNLVGNGRVVLDQNGVLTDADPPDPTPDLREVNARMKVFQVQLQPPKTYVITLDSDDFDPYLRVESPTGQPLAEDDDSGGDLNAKIVFRPQQPGLYRIIATSFDGFTGGFRLKVQEAN